jgi:hypothetical protein
MLGSLTAARMRMQRRVSSFVDGGATHSRARRLAAVALAASAATIVVVATIVIYVRHTIRRRRARARGALIDQSQYSCTLGTRSLSSVDEEPPRPHDEDTIDAGDLAARDALAAAYTRVPYLSASMRLEALAGRGVGFVCCAPIAAGEVLLVDFVWSVPTDATLPYDWAAHALDESCTRSSRA